MFFLLFRVLLAIIVGAGLVAIGDSIQLAQTRANFVALAQNYWLEQKASSVSHRRIWDLRQEIAELKAMIVSQNQRSGAQMAEISALKAEIRELEEYISQIKEEQ